MADMKIPLFNQVAIGARVWAEPKQEDLPDGTPHCSFRVSIPGRAAGKSFTWFLSVDAYYKTAERLLDPAIGLAKGDVVLLDGQLKQQPEYENRDGKKVTPQMRISLRNYTKIDVWDDTPQSSPPPPKPQPAPIPEDDIPF